MLTLIFAVCVASKLSSVTTVSKLNDDHANKFSGQKCQYLTPIVLSFDLGYKWH